MIIFAFHHSLSCLCVSNGILQEEDFGFFSNLPNTKNYKCPCENLETTKSEDNIPKEQEDKVLNYLKNYSSDNEKEENKESDQELQITRDEVTKMKHSKKKKHKKTEPEPILEGTGETSIELSKMNFCFEFFQRFLIVGKHDSKFHLENFDWHEYKGLKSYVIC